jgi:lysozyme
VHKWLAATALLWGSISFASEEDCDVPKRLDGIDVSSYQGDVDWKRVKASGVVFAFARVSDGLDVIDELFPHNFVAMKRAGVRRGAYQYFRASADPEAQAELMVKAVARLGGADLPLVVDVETDDGQKAEELQARLRRWLRRVERRTRRKPMVYTSPSMSQKLGARFGDYSLWIAHYQVDCPTVPEGWRRWTFWQHSSTGKVPGIAGRVDLDHFAGSLAELRRFLRKR